MDVKQHLWGILIEFLLDQFNYDCGCDFDQNFDFDVFWDATVSVIIKEGCS